ncbi:MAG: DNA glycosylase AlkZ-like family protein, partial [Gaiellaceae bacterium]
REAELLRAERQLQTRGTAAPKELPWPPGGTRPAVLLGELARKGRAVPVAVESVAGERYVHVEDLVLLDRLESGEWEPRTTLLSPFDTLVNDRDRAEALFGFRFRLEIYVPKAKRQYGYFVLPVLHGDRLIGRVDPEYDRKRRVLTINAAHWEPDAPASGRKAALKAIQELGAWLGAERVDYARAVTTSQ